MIILTKNQINFYSTYWNKIFIQRKQQKTFINNFKYS